MTLGEREEDKARENVGRKIKEQRDEEKNRIWREKWE